MAMTLAFRVYFVVAGLGLLAASVAVLINFRGFGTRSEEDVYAHSKEVNRLARLPWATNPMTGKAWRPYAAIFGAVIGIGLVLTGLFAR